MNSAEPFIHGREQAIVKHSCNGNLFNVSSLKEYDEAVDTNGFAIKFVTEGCERYQVNKQCYSVGAGSYLLLNGTMDARVEIDSKKSVEGICINISNTIIEDAVASFTRPDTPYSDPSLASFFYTEQFLENQYQAANTLLGKELNRIGKEVQQNLFAAGDINTELFFGLAERLIADQLLVFKQLHAIKAVKQETRKDLCRRLIRGKEIIDSCYTHPLSIEQLARESTMSAFHFFRLFKLVFGISPHQYIIRKRLEAARSLLEAHCTVTDTAIQCGFADIFTFSKAFKKHFGVAPSLLCKEK